MHVYVFKNLKQVNGGTALVVASSINIVTDLLDQRGLHLTESDIIKVQIFPLKDVVNLVYINTVENKGTKMNSRETKLVRAGLALLEEAITSGSITSEMERYLEGTLDDEEVRAFSEELAESEED